MVENTNEEDFSFSNKGVTLEDNEGRNANEGLVNDQVEVIEEEAPEEVEVTPEEVPTEEPEVNESKEEEVSEEEPNLYENFEVEKDPTTVPNSELVELSEKYGVEGVSSIDDLISKVVETQKAQVPVFASDEIKGLVEQMNEVHQAGGDFRVIQDVATKIQKAESEVKELETHVSALNAYLQSDDIEAKKEYLKYHFKAEMKMTGNTYNIAVDALDNMSDIDIIEKSHNAISNALMSNSSRLDTKKSGLGELAAKKDNAVFEARRSAEEAKKVIAESINKFEDADSKIFTSRTRNISEKAFSTSQKNYMLPSGVAELLFTTDGVVDMGKLMNTINGNVNGADKIKHLTTLAKHDQFRGLKNQKKKISKTSNVESTPTGDDEFSSIDFGDRRKVKIGSVTTRN